MSSIDWLSVPLLGKVPDREIADRLGVSRETVNAARFRLGIKKRRVIDWDNELLGEVMDKDIASKLGVSVGSVTSARLRRGIESFKERQAKSIQRFCPGCCVTKFASEFSSRKKGQSSHLKCRSCRSVDKAVYAKERARNPKVRKQIRDYDKTYYALHGCRGPKQAAVKAWIVFLKNNPCLDCGGRFPPEAMDFDHREGSAKLFEVSMAMATSMPKERIEAEISKCDLVCANCHRVRTHRRYEQRRAERRRRILGE